MNKSASSSRKKSKHSLRLGVAANLIAAYLELPEDLRESFEKVLALQVYGMDGIHLYLRSHDGWDSTLRSAMSKHRVLAEPWFDWAQRRVLVGRTQDHGGLC